MDRIVPQTIDEVVAEIEAAVDSHEASEIYLAARPFFKKANGYYQIVDAMNARWLANYEAKNAPANFVISKVEGRRRNRGAGRNQGSWVPTVRWTITLEGIDWHDLGDEHRRVKNVLVYSYTRRKDAVKAIECLRKRGADQLAEVLTTRKA